MTSATAAGPARPARAAAAPPAPPARAKAREPGIPSAFGWWLFLIYLVLEFDRPPVVVQLRLQMLIAIVLPLLWLGGRDRPWSSVLTAQIVFLLAGAAMVPFAENWYAAYFSTRTVFSSVGIALAMSWLFANREGMARFHPAWMLVIAWVGVFGITHGGTGPGGFLGDENDLALGCVSAFPFAFYGFQLLGGWKRWAAAACGLVLVMATVVSVSRGGFVGLAAAFLYCIVTGSNRGRNLLLAFVSGLVFLVAAPQSYMKEIYSISETDKGTADSRQFLWLTAVNVWKEHPIFGIGGGNFNYVAGGHTPKGGRWDKPEYQERNWSGTTVHSTYFQILSEFGLLGILSFGAIAVGHLRGVSRIRRLAHRRRSLPKKLRDEIELYSGSLAAGMIGVLAASAFLSAAFYPYVYFFSGAGVALVTWASRAMAAETGAKSPKEEPGEKA